MASTAVARGFTLLELLIVMVIIAVLAGAAVLSIGIVGDDREIEQEVFRLRSLMDLLQEEALMQSRDYGVLFTDDGYRFYAYDYQQLRWVEPAGDDLLQRHDLPEALSLDLRVEDRDLVLESGADLQSMGGDEADDDPEPQVMLLSSGEMTPFEVAISSEFTGGRFTLTADLDGTLEVSQDES